MAELNQTPGVERRLARTYRRLRNIALWKAFWPLGLVVSVFIALALFGVLVAARPQIGAVATLTFLCGAAITLVHGLYRYRRPTKSDAVTVLDNQSDLRPIQSLADRPARPTKDAIALWRAHEARLVVAAKRLQVPRFTKVWKVIDPVYLRYGLPALLAAAFAFAGGQTPSRLMASLSPDYGSLLGAEQVRVEAWITPPQHTGRAPVLFKPDQSSARVPAGSVMTLRVQAPSAPKLRLETSDAGQTERFIATPDGAYEAEAQINADMSVSVRWWGERRRFELLASPDAPPTATFVELPVLGEGDRTEFGWTVSDDYGVARLALAIAPENDPRAPDLIPVELGAVSPKDAEDTAALDLTRHRYAGLRVEAKLIATDGAGQTGQSKPHVFVLPEKLLLQPLAKAIQDVRVTLLREDTAYELRDDVSEDGLSPGALYLTSTQRLAQAPAGVVRASIMLDALTYEAPRYFNDILIYSGLRSALRSLEAASSLEDAKALEPLLWGLALRAEYGTAADALAKLLAAKAALEEALRDGATEEEIARLTDAFKQAAQNFLAARMAEALANGLEAPPPSTDGAEQGGGPGLSGQSFSDMLDALEDLTETGASDQARQLLSDITNMLENLEFQQGGEGSGEGFPGLPGGDGENDEDLPENERELSDTMRELSELLRQQRELNDETLAQQRGERGKGGSSDQQPNLEDPEGDTQGDGPGRQAPDWLDGQDDRSLAERQDRLGDLVEELMRRQGQAGTGTGDENSDGEDGGGLLDQDTLEAIERAQRRAGRALEDGNEMRALRNQEQATRQLRDLAEGLAERLDELREARLGPGEEGFDGEADPFGRSAMGGIDDSNSVDIPDQIERQRARDILDELRRRYGDTLNEEERDYLERLLDRF